MPRSYTTNGRLILPADGEEDGVWGQVVNTNSQILDRITNGVVTITLSGASYALDTSDGAASVGHYPVLIFNGSPTSTVTVTVGPATIQRTYTVINDTGQSIVFTQGSGGDVTVAAGSATMLYCDGAGATARVGDIAGNFPNALFNAGVTATAEELNKLDGYLGTTADLNILHNFTGTVTDLNYAADLRATGVTTSNLGTLAGFAGTSATFALLYAYSLRSVSELEFGTLNGIDTSQSIQAQLDSKMSQAALDSKASLAGADFTGSITVAGTIAASNTISSSTGFSTLGTVSAGTVNADFLNLTSTLNVPSLVASGDVDASGSISAAGATLTSGLSGTTASFSGSISAAGATLTSGLSGTTASFSGGVSAAGATLSSALSGTTASFSGGVSAAGATLTSGLSGTTAVFSGTLVANGVGSSGAFSVTGASTLNTTNINGQVTAAQSVEVASGDIWVGIERSDNSTTNNTNKVLLANGSNAFVRNAIIIEGGETVSSGSGALLSNRDEAANLYLSKTTAAEGVGGDRNFAVFSYDGTAIGTIQKTDNVNSVAYNTTSDYRLKENVTPMPDAAARLMALNPCRFNFIGSERTVDGFLAHEAATVVPEAVSGDKDAVDADGNPIYQGIDQSKLVPLLVAALQEALQRIEALETGA